MARAFAREAMKPAQGKLAVMQYCLPDQLEIDPTYQRSIDVGGSQSLIRRIAMHWDWGLCQPLTVAKRDDGSLWVVDGRKPSLRSWAKDMRASSRVVVRWAPWSGVVLLSALRRRT